MIYKIEATEREASIKIHTGKLYLIQLDGREKGSQGIVQGSKIYPQRDRHSSSHIHMRLQRGSVLRLPYLENDSLSLGGRMMSEWKVKLYPIE